MKQGASATKGAMMVNTGTSITLVTRKWVETYALMVALVMGISITGTNGTPVEMVGTCTMMFQLSPMLELNISDINISSGDF